MFDPEFLAMLVCPTTRQPLREASADELDRVNGAIAEGRCRNRVGDPVTEKVQAGLATEDGAWLYPIRDEIPILLAPEAIRATGRPPADDPATEDSATT